MKIGDFAQAARTTTRAVRHYHQLGLLPEPARRANGYREYELADLVRMLRITWLSKAGVPLATVGDLLARESDHGDGRSVEHDLAIVAQTIQAERDRLTRQLNALEQIQQSVASGRRLSSLAPALADAFDRVADAAAAELVTDSDPADPAMGDPADDSAAARARAVVERDREMLEILALSGQLPDEVTAAYVALADDPQQLRSALRIMSEFAALEGKRPREVDGRIDALVDLLLQTTVVSRLITGAEPAEMPHDDDLAFFMPDPAQREVARRLMERSR